MGLGEEIGEVVVEVEGDEDVYGEEGGEFD